MRVSGSAVTRKNILDIINMTNETLLSKEYTDNTTQDIIRTANLILDSADEQIVCSNYAFLFILLIEKLDTDEEFLQLLITELKLKLIRFISLEIKSNYLTEYNNTIQQKNSVSQKQLVPSCPGDFVLPPEGLLGTVQTKVLEEDAKRYKIIDSLVDSKGYVLDETITYEEVGLESAYRNPNANNQKSSEVR